MRIYSSARLTALSQIEGDEIENDFRVVFPSNHPRTLGIRWKSVRISRGPNLSSNSSHDLISTSIGIRWKWLPVYNTDQRDFHVIVTSDPRQSPQFIANSAS